MTSLVVVSAGLSSPSSTRLLAERLTAATVEALEEVVRGTLGSVGRIPRKDVP
jgi:FMN reductase